MPRKVRVGLIGYQFMGKAHSNAYLNVGKFFDLDATPVMQAVCGRNRTAVKEFARKWGWASYETDYRKLVKRKDIDLIDICTPNNSHRDIVMAAAEAGKAIACEKPLAMNVAEAEEMLKAVRAAKIRHMIWFNYRRCPAIGLAKRLIDEGRIGRVFHVRAVYLQDWIVDPKFPLAWRLQKEVAGSGAHGDLNAHLIDLARYLVGEMTEVVGLAKTFIKTRPVESKGGGLAGKAGKGKGKVTVDDAVLFLAHFAGGAVGSFEATRFASGRKNYNRIEINGSKGSLVFLFEKMNELQFFSRQDPEHAQGFKTILATEPVHPYMEAYWPPGHILGYEHTFVNQASDLINGVARNKPLKPDFSDGLACQKVMDAVLESVERKSWVKIA
jgi:predicted dehydrogenase